MTWARWLAPDQGRLSRRAKAMEKNAMKGNKPCQMTPDVAAMEEQEQQSIDLGATLGCSNQEALGPLPAPPSQSSFLDELDACIGGVDPGLVEDLMGDLDNTSPDELAELAASCGLGAAFSAGTGPGAILGCGFGALANELSELGGNTVGMAADVVGCMTGD